MNELGENVDMIYMVVGFLILANGATIIAVLGSAMKISSEFGSLKTEVKINVKDIQRNEKRIHILEGTR